MANPIFLKISIFVLKSPFFLEFLQLWLEVQHAAQNGTANRAVAAVEMETRGNGSTRLDFDAVFDQNHNLIEIRPNESNRSHFERVERAAGRVEIGLTDWQVLLAKIEQKITHGKNVKKTLKNFKKKLQKKKIQKKVKKKKFKKNYQKNQKISKS